MSYIANYIGLWIVYGLGILITHNRDFSIFNDLSDKRLLPSGILNLSYDPP